MDARTFRVSVVAECKYSREKPWVIFCSAKSRPSLEASITYVVGSHFAEALLWFMAREPRLKEVQRHFIASRFGFGGRQAFTEKGAKDPFYSSLQSVVSAATSFAPLDDGEAIDAAKSVRLAHFVFPAIVVDGGLFEAYLDGAELKVEEVPQSRVTWRGSDVREQPAFVDIVTVDALEKYASTIAGYGEHLLYAAPDFAAAVAKAVVGHNPRDLPHPSNKF